MTRYAEENGMVVAGYVLQSTEVELKIKAYESYKNGNIDFKTLIGNAEYFTDKEFKKKDDALKALSQNKTSIYVNKRGGLCYLTHYELIENYAYPDSLDEIEDCDIIADSGILEI